MKFLRDASLAWRQDNVLRRIVRNSGYLFVGSTLSTVVQSILSARLLGILGFGILGTVIEFATNINRLLSFRMGELVVKYISQYLVEERKDRAAAVFKASILLESTSSILAYLLLLLLAPLAARLVVQDISLSPLITFYALALLGNFATESSSGFLQVTDRFRSQALIGFIQSMLTAGLIIYAYLTHGDIWVVLGAYLVGKVFNGLALAGYAFWRARQTLGAGWWRTSLRLLPPRREFWHFAWSTNLSGTVTMLTRDSESIWLSSLLSPLAAGYYKTARAVINLVTLPITPFITAAYPALTKSVAEKAWERLRSLLRKLTLISGLWTAAVSVGLLLFGNWLIRTFYGSEFTPATSAMLILLIGFGFANIFYWNRNLLLAFGDPGYPLKVTAICGAVKVALTLILVPVFGYEMEAVLLSAFFVVTIGLILLRSRRLMQQAMHAGVASEGEESDSLIPEGLVTDPAQGAGMRPRLRWNPVDWLAVLIFLVFSAWFFLGRMQGNFPITILTGDAGNIASYAAARDHPDWFTSDAVLGENSRFQVYATVHIPLIRALNRLTGDYGQASAWLVLPQTFLQLLGFYLLGRVLFKDRLWAFLLAFLTAMTVRSIGLGEIWGIWHDSLPRVVFQSLLPFLLVLVLIWKDHPARWPWLMVFAGLLVYVHPISAPAWGLAIWLSLWLLIPHQWSPARRITILLGLGLLFLVVIAPFAFNYLSYRGIEPQLTYETVMPLLLATSPANLFDVPAAGMDFLWQQTRSLLIPLALVGFILTWRLKKNDRKEIRIVLTWMAGILITSILIPLVERFIESRFQILPIETEFLRGVRYFVPLLLLFWLWPLASLTAAARRWTARVGIFLIGIMCVGFWGATNRPAIGDMIDVLDCFSKGKLVCVTSSPLTDLLTAVQGSTRPGEGIFFYNQDLAATSQSLSVRYAALRPLVYSYRDSGILGYGSRATLPAWLETTRQVETIRSLSDPVDQVEYLAMLALSLEARYLIYDQPLSEQDNATLPGEVLYQNELYTLIALP